MSTSPNWIEKNWFAEIRKIERTYLNGGNIIVKSGIFRVLKGFDEELSTGEDYDFSMRAKKLDVGPFFDDRLIVHHEGNPKSIPQFIKREKWHAQGDLASLQRFFKSKVMMGSLFYLILLLVAFVFFISGKFLTFLSFFFLMSFLCVSLATLKLGWLGKKTIQTSVIMNFYLLGRGWALIDKLSEATLNLFHSNRV